MSFLSSSTDAAGGSMLEATIDYNATTAAAGSGRLYFLDPPRAPGELGRLGGYRVLRVLGLGGMGVVFEAEDALLRRRVALKVMKPHLAARPDARQRFLREGRTAAAVEHENIVAILQVGAEHGIPFIAMPLLRGQTLAARIGRPRDQSTGNSQGTRRDVDEATVLGDDDPYEPETDTAAKRLAAGEVVRIGREIAAGLAAAHEHGLIHRDVKPSNIWLDERTGRVMLLDFGLARAADDDQQLTQTGIVLGTPCYMSPEQARGETVDHRSDLFSLGCVLYHIATGQRPFKGTNTFSTLFAVTTQQPAAPATVNPGLPQPLDQLIRELLAKQKEERPESARRVFERLVEMERLHDDWPPAEAAPSTPVEHSSRPSSETARRGDTPVEIEALVRRWYDELWNKGRLAVIDELLSPDCTLHAQGNELRGRAAARERLEALHAAFSDCDFVIEQIAVQGQIATVRWRAHFTHTGAWMGQAPSGRRLIVRGSSWLRVANGLLAEGWDYWDQQQVLAAHSSPLAPREERDSSPLAPREERDSSPLAPREESPAA